MWSNIKDAVLNARRRQGWVVENTDGGKATNLAVAGAHYVAASERVGAWPSIVKIDISPLCNLRCTVCVHAAPNGNPELEKQSFRAAQRMSLEQYSKIIDEIAGRTSAVSLYYLGDPLMHPDLDEMAALARASGLNVHVSTNFSFDLDEKRLDRLAASGVTHFTVCVDGLTQEAYGRTRVGGQIGTVLRNLRGLLRARTAAGSQYPRVEVQYLKYHHNLGELEGARMLFQSLGVDHVTEYWGSLHNYTDLDPERAVVGAPKATGALPRCYWPWVSMVIKWNGDVIPCCNHRLSAQHADGGDSRVLGNVFDSGVLAVWNAPDYRAVRRIAKDPTRAEAAGEATGSFCYGCPLLFETDREDRARSARDWSYEELWDVTGTRFPRRRAAN